MFWGAVVTGRVYDLSPRMQEKRNVRYAVAAELRRIVGEHCANGTRDAPSRLIKLKS